MELERELGDFIFVIKIGCASFWFGWLVFRVVVGFSFFRRHRKMLGPATWGVHIWSWKGADSTVSNLPFSWLWDLKREVRYGTICEHGSLNVLLNVETATFSLIERETRVYR